MAERDQGEYGLGWITPRLRVWALELFGPSSRIDAVTRMPGHSGITFGFELVREDTREAVVLRIPPAGVRRKNSTDVLRLVPLLQAMAAAGIPVPRVRWYGEDETFFGVPYLIVERVSGATLPDIFTTSDGPAPSGQHVSDSFTTAVDILAAIHGSDVTGLQDAGWANRMSQADDIDMWVPLLEKSEDDGPIREGLDLRRRLHASLPAAAPPTVVHGDYYSNNWLFDEEHLSAVLDWENSTLASPMWDIGWMAAMYDPECWGPARTQSLAWAPPVDFLLERYAKATGTGLDRPDWYRALMCYRLACITPLNLRLHRTGRRVDPAWEVFGEAMPRLFQRARDLLGAR